jgi:hypothetical protein
MTDLSSIVSSTSAYVASQTAKLGKAASDAQTSFSSALTRAQVDVGIKPKAGFTKGATYEATTVTGQAQAALRNTVNAAKSALNIKP